MALASVSPLFVSLWNDNAAESNVYSLAASFLVTMIETSEDLRVICIRIFVGLDDILRGQIAPVECYLVVVIVADKVTNYSDHIFGCVILSDPNPLVHCCITSDQFFIL